MTSAAAYSLVFVDVAGLSSCSASIVLLLFSCSANIIRGVNWYSFWCLISIAAYILWCLLVVLALFVTVNRLVTFFLPLLRFVKLVINWNFNLNGIQG